MSKQPSALMTNHVLLDNIIHKDLRVKPGYPEGGGYHVNIARVFPVEFRRLQVEYPLFFVKNTETGHFDPIALLGLARGENLYLDDGAWDADHVPLTIQRQPLLIGYREQLEDGVPTQVPVVHIDMDHPSVNRDEGEPLFLPHGGESPWLEHKMSVLMAIHEGHAALPSFSQRLVGLELIETAALEFELADGSSQSVTGLHTVNEDKLRSLGANGLEALHRKGHLEDVYMMIASLQNLPRLIERKNRRLKG